MLSLLQIFSVNVASNKVHHVDSSSDDRNCIFHIFAGALKEGVGSVISSVVVFSQLIINKNPVNNFCRIYTTNILVEVLKLKNYCF